MRLTDHLRASLSNMTRKSCDHNWPATGIIATFKKILLKFTFSRFLAKEI
jgi:hypothetical protein